MGPPLPLVRRFGKRCRKARNLTVLFVAVTVPALLPAQKNTNEQTFSSPRCGISLRYPEGWLVTQSPLDTHAPEQRVCELRILPKDLSSHVKNDGNSDLYTIDFYIDDIDYVDALSEAGFSKEGKHWVMYGSGAGESPAEEISSPAWVGMKVTTTDRCYREDGDYVGLCQCFHAVLGSRSDLTATINGRPQSEDVFNSIIKSLKFIAWVPADKSR